MLSQPLDAKSNKTRANSKYPTLTDCRARFFLLHLQFILLQLQSQPRSHSDNHDVVLVVFFALVAASPIVHVSLRDDRQIVQIRPQIQSSRPIDQVQYRPATLPWSRGWRRRNSGVSSRWRESYEPASGTRRYRQIEQRCQRNTATVSYYGAPGPVFLPHWLMHDYWIDQLKAHRIFSVILVDSLEGYRSYSSPSVSASMRSNGEIRSSKMRTSIFYVTPMIYHAECRARTTRRPVANKGWRRGHHSSMSFPTRLPSFAPPRWSVRFEASKLNNKYTTSHASCRNAYPYYITLLTTGFIDSIRRKPFVVTLFIQVDLFLNQRPLLWFNIFPFIVPLPFSFVTPKGHLRFLILFDHWYDFCTGVERAANHAAQFPYHTHPLLRIVIFRCWLSQLLLHEKALDATLWLARWLLLFHFPSLSLAFFRIKSYPHLYCMTRRPVECLIIKPPTFLSPQLIHRFSIEHITLGNLSEKWVLKTTRGLLPVLLVPHPQSAIDSKDTPKRLRSLAAVTVASETWIRHAVYERWSDVWPFVLILQF